MILFKDSALIDEFKLYVASMVFCLFFVSLKVEQYVFLISSLFCLQEPDMDQGHAYYAILHRQWMGLFMTSYIMTDVLSSVYILWTTFPLSKLNREDDIARTWHKEQKYFKIHLKYTVIRILHFYMYFEAAWDQIILITWIFMQEVWDTFWHWNGHGV